ncbi:MAG: histidine--tRNA ligase [Actinobacteria bacterium]|uniref:histidine--tRNA ligase n=1 Tax=freshwater metagenome TaxID=449393 RepID=A0A6J6H7D8_9ZZZZ|nr:histidine--tRNA ligase [Rhodoluna sp.]MSZ95248.1 histidine--tRNA ligase [Actinomycetota bacterium]
MANPVNPPRGMRDFLPEDKRARDLVLNKILETYSDHGYQEIETPALEDLEKLTSGQGGDNEKLAFRVMKRGAELDEAMASSGELSDLGLRYDLTVPLTRYYATNRSSLPTVFKAIQTGPVWRAERPQKGRYRQFVQCDIDIIGDGSLLAEVDLLTSSLAALDSLGLSDAVIRVNHRSLLISLLDSLGVASSEHGSAMISIDKLDKLGADGVAAELEERFGIGAAFSSWISTLDVSVIPAELQEIFSVVGSARLKYDPTLVRGMGYYTGAIFEIEHPGSGSSIGGGGRYDGMVGKWLGSDVPAVGISLGFERVMDLVSPSLFATSGDAVVLVVEGDVLAKAIEIRASLIAQGYRVRFESRPKKLNSLLESMAANGFTHFATLDENTTEIELRPIA